MPCGASRSVKEKIRSWQLLPDISTEEIIIIAVYK